jgi:hypothetical protein
MRILAVFGRPKEQQDAMHKRSGTAHNERRMPNLIVLLLSAFMLAAVTCDRAAGAPDDGEYAVKAAFVYNFAKYVEWPADAFPKPDSPFVIGIVGKDPFDGALDRTIQGKNVNGHAFVIRRLGFDQDMAQCEIIFVSSSERDKVGRLPGTLKNAPVLAVGESAGFASHGGHIGFFSEQGRIRFEINPEAAKRARLNISSKLLALARIVSDSK